MECTFPTLSSYLFCCNTSLSECNSLFLSSVVLLTPHLMAKGTQTTPDLEARTLWDNNFFDRARSELLAFLALPDWRNKVAREDVAAVLNLVLWSDLAGLSQLRGQLLEVMDSVFNALLANMEVRLWQTPPVESHNNWFLYWELCRLAHNRLVANWIWNQSPIELNQLAIPLLPMPGVWQAIQSADFEPSLMPRPFLASDVLSFLDFDSADPRRHAMLANFGGLLVSLRNLPLLVYAILRDRVDRFHRRCQVSGFLNLALVPENQHDLLKERNELDATINQIRASFSPEILQAVKGGNARPIIDALTKASGASNYGYIHSLFLAALGMLRLELCTGLVSHVQLSDSDEIQSLESLAEEYQEPAKTFLLEEAVLYTRFLESWSSAAPEDLVLVLADSAPVFKLLRLHIGFYAKFKASIQQGSISQFSLTYDPVTSLDLLEQLRGDVTVCVRVLRRFAKWGARHAEIYANAVRLVSLIGLGGMESLHPKQR